MSRVRRVAPLVALVALAVFAASSIAATSHAKLFQNKSKSAICGVKIHAPKKPATVVICSATGIPKAKSGVGDPFVQIKKTGKAQLILQSQNPFVGKKATNAEQGLDLVAAGRDLHGRRQDRDVQEPVQARLHDRQRQVQVVLGLGHRDR